MKKFIFISLMIFTQISFAQIDRKGNGGDAVSLEFKAMGQAVTDAIIDKGIVFTSGVSVKTLQDTIRRADVRSVSTELYLDGVRKDAINYPYENRIDISLTQWSYMTEKVKYQLVIHEALGLLSINDADYARSNSLINAVSSDQLKQSVKAIQVAKAKEPVSIQSVSCDNYKGDLDKEKQRQINLATDDFVTRNMHELLSSEGDSIQVMRQSFRYSGTECTSIFFSCYMKRYKGTYQVISRSGAFNIEATIYSYENKDKPNGLREEKLTLTSDEKLDAVGRVISPATHATCSYMLDLRDKGIVNLDTKAAIHYYSNIASPFVSVDIPVF